MRNAFADELTKQAQSDSRIVLLSGDIGNRLFDDFKSKNPGRFYNCGVAEANMASLAAGLAMNNLRPITYTIASFNTTRCLEQIRVDICYHNLPVIIVGVGAGLSYASLGGTHHSCEDISFLRSLPNMTVLCPGDALELRALFKEALKHEGPVYLRIGKKGEEKVHAQEPSLQIGKALIVKEGKDVCLLSTGNMLSLAISAAGMLESQGISTQVVSMHTVKPLDRASLIEYAGQFSVLASIEEHSLIGGLGGALAEWAIDDRVKPPILRFGTKDEFSHKLGSQEFVREQFNLTPSQIATAIYQEHQKYAYLSSTLS